MGRFDIDCSAGDTTVHASDEIVLNLGGVEPVGHQPEVGSASSTRPTATLSFKTLVGDLTIEL